jgi:hypothetical protein
MVRDANPRGCQHGRILQCFGGCCPKLWELFVVLDRRVAAWARASSSVPDQVVAVPKRRRAMRTVAAALDHDAWTADITGALTDGPGSHSVSSAYPVPGRCHASAECSRHVQLELVTFRPVHVGFSLQHPLPWPISSVRRQRALEGESS